MVKCWDLSHCRVTDATSKNSRCCNRFVVSFCVLYSLYGKTLNNNASKTENG
eukprot:m.255694 g.255694  ORF g.255694 m.255694 type:complete len:52 (-) comp20091_c0_seq1:934-1089(-)